MGFYDDPNAKPKGVWSGGADQNAYNKKGELKSNKRSSFYDDEIAAFNERPSTKIQGADSKADAYGVKLKNGKTPQQLIDEYNSSTNSKQREAYRRQIEAAAADKNSPDYELANLIKPRISKSFFEDVGDFVGGANEATFGATQKGIVNLVNTIATGGNKKEAERRTAEFLVSSGANDGDGKSRLSSGANIDSNAGRIGQAVGSTGAIITGTGLVDPATRLVEQIGSSSRQSGSGALADPELVKNQIDYIRSEVKKGKISQTRGNELITKLNEDSRLAKENLKSIQQETGVTASQGAGVQAGAEIGLAAVGIRGASKANLTPGSVAAAPSAQTTSVPVKKTAVSKLDEAVSLAGKKVADKFYATTPGQKVKQAITATQTKLQNSAAPIYRQLDELQTSGRLTENQVKNAKSLIQTSRFSARTLADDFLKSDVDANVLLAPLNGKTLGGRSQQNLSDYINARNELNLIEIDKKRGKQISPSREDAFKKQVAELGTPEFEARFDADVNLNRKLTDLLVEEGLVSPQQRDAWRNSNTEYIRVQRLLDGESEIRGQGAGSKISRGSTIATQKRKGSTKKATDALETAIDRTNRVWSEITSNRAANAYIEALGEAGALGKQLRSAEKVQNRQDLREALVLSRPLKKQLDRFEQSQSQYVRRIQNELNKLNKQGLDASLARPIADENLAGKLADPGAKMTKAELQSVLDNIVENTDTQLLKVIRKKISKREPKLAKAIEELEDIQTVLSGVNAERYKQYNQLAQNADEKVKRRPTIQRMKDGIKEIYETTPEIEAAAKGFGPVYMGTVGKVISAPVRFLQTTITGGLNPAWAAISIPRDFVEGFVLSRRAAQTHNPANVLASALEAAGIKKTDDKLFQQFMAYERGSSSIIDLTKGAKDNARTIRELSRQQMPVLKRGASVIKTPKDWYETIQNASKWNEFAAKYQNFRGNYNKLIKDGLPQDQAMNIALYEARNATGNLLEKGDWTKALAAVYPYFNPAVQGGTTLMKAFRDRPVSTSAKILTGIQIPAVIATAWNMSDPRRAEAYLDISPEERERYTIIVLPGSEKTDGKWQVVKIPKAPGVGNFANPIERMMIGMYGEDPGNTEKTWQSLIKAFGSPIDPGSVNQAIGSAIPFQLKSGIEAVSNFDFYSGKEIVPDWLKEENPDEPYKQAFDNSSSTAKLIGKALGISPLIVNNFLSDTTGEFGRNVIWSSDTALEALGAEGGVGGRSPIESVTRAYSGAYGGEREKEAKTQLNDLFNRKTSVSSKITDALANKDVDTASQIANEYNDEITALQRFIEENKRTVNLSEKQMAAIENNRFPVQNGKLSQSSIKSRLRNLNK